MWFFESIFLFFYGNQMNLKEGFEDVDTWSFGNG